MRLAACPIVLCCLWALSDESKPGETRIDDAENYEEHQDIRRALNNTERRWMIYRTYLRRTNSKKHTCVYAIVKSQEEDGLYMFEQGYAVEENGNTNTDIKKETLYASTYKTDLQTYLNVQKTRDKDNAMRVHREKSSTGGKEYKLVYSDYKKCYILRVLSEDGGHGCELYLLDAVADEKVPAACERTYENACGKFDDRYKSPVYNSSCKKIMGSLDETPTPTQATPEPPEKETAGQEPDTTPSTLPPGC
uniref:Putative lipocalin-2 1 n=1 Tax=Ixodes ricinus TaxID=34613 RepID=V5GMV6_IXORI